MKVLVAGGAGYIGSQVAWDLIRAGHDVVVVDNLSTGLRSFVHPDARFYQADITQANQLAEVFAREAQAGHPCDLVMHFAAKLDVAESVDLPLDYYRNNVEGVRCLLQSMLKAGVKNIVFSSTAAVYGDPVQNEPLNESAATAPINPYGASKLAAEQLIQWTAAAHGFNYAILRYFNAAGADKSLKIGLNKPRYTHLIPLAVRASLGLEKPVSVFGDDWPTPDGSCIRDYIHVADLSSAHLLAAAYLLEEKQSLLLNLGTQEGSSVKEVIAAVDALRPCPYELAPRRQGDPAILIADATKARTLLGWQARRSLTDIVNSDMDYRIHDAAQGSSPR
ncbi:MAG: UDP-glucose 4-epimerase GalE [Coriobacteriia bacterium]|nr:UDP-glucose 4-epimerase GalE [Coriobacteriia bacterium]MCL2537059.1 UDP-glucose 4-epimerase GalE [Coriobacteriia bacterium]